MEEERREGRKVEEVGSECIYMLDQELDTVVAEG